MIKAFIIITRIDFLMRRKIIVITLQYKDVIKMSFLEGKQRAKISNDRSQSVSDFKISTTSQPR